MPRYYFNIVVGKGEPIPDLDGDELAGDQVALQHAEMVAREMLGDRSRYARTLTRWSFLVTDKDGRQLGLVRFADYSRPRAYRTSLARIGQNCESC
jgi:hypothetical protein